MEIEVAPPADGCAPVGEAGLVPALLNSGEVYRQHVVAVRRALLRLGVRDAELEDATQDVFIVLLRRLGDYDGQHAAKHWLMGIARRVASTYRRSARRRGAFMNRFSEHPLSPRMDTPDAHMERSHVSEVVTEFLDGLDPAKCAVFVLSEIKGLSGPEISDVLGVNLNTVYWRLRTARKAFDHMVERRQQPRQGQLAAFFLWPVRQLQHTGRAAWHTAVTAAPLVISVTTIGATVDAAPSVPEPRSLQVPDDEDRHRDRAWIPTAVVPEDDGILVFPAAEPIPASPEPGSTRKTQTDGFRDRGRPLPRVGARPPVADGAAAVARSSVFHTVRNHVNEIRACYNQVLINKPGVEGRLVVSFRITAEGGVDKVDVDRSEIDDAMLSACVVETVRAWSFPASSDGQAVMVRYPFVLTIPADEPPAVP
jgi:RNA polymerase sigma-70 factor (ECF subfamily)